MYKIFVCFFTFSFALGNYSTNFKYSSYGEEELRFEGEEYWDDEYIKQCDDVTVDTTWQWRKAICFIHIVCFQSVKVEIVAWRPGLVIYRDLFSKKQVSAYMDLVNNLSMEEQLVVDDDGSEFFSKIRKANGTHIRATDYPASHSILKTVKTLIPNLNFDSSEDIVALSYQRGGHYATHHDYLLYPSEKEWDEWMRNYGNRFGTLIMAFEKAEKGGATIFPALGAAIRPNPGDAFFWFNAQGDTTQEDLSEHGGCPIYEGRKTISTIWVRMNSQPILHKILSPGSISALTLFTPNL